MKIQSNLHTNIGLETSLLLDDTLSRSDDELFVDLVRTKEKKRGNRTGGGAEDTQRGRLQQQEKRVLRDATDDRIAAYDSSAEQANADQITAHRNVIIR